MKNTFQKNNFFDQTNREIILREIPKKIISVVPSQTELLYDLGLDEEVIGITKFCIHPEKWFREKTRIGGTKKLDIEKIKLLNPDLIIANKEENEKSQIEELARDFNVWISDIKTLDDALQMILRIGEITNKKERAGEIKQKIEIEFEKIIFRQVKKKFLRTAYFIWKKPFMVAGEDTFIDEMLRICGLENVFPKNIFSDTRNTRYPEISAEQLKAANPEIILLSSEPYPFKEKHIEEFKLICPQAKIKIVDGELFSWYGSRLLESPAYFAELIKGF
ncbi:MAG: helical backbone metal receptor [Bacteroidia bacterium]